MGYLQVTLNGMYGDDEGPKVVELCEKALIVLFNDYKEFIQTRMQGVFLLHHPMMQPNHFPLAKVLLIGVCLVVLVMQLQQEKNLAEVKRRKTKSSVTKDSKSELDRYLIEEIEGDEAYFKSGDFTVLVASESTFRTEGRVLDSFRSSLSPETVQALICCQDWVRSVDIAVNLEENIDDLKKFEDGNLLFPFPF
uniref:HAT C-terminal dimerisation domain-containing protein n=1 Tax=Tanacetum cinerariifolium TaxID=118510 RepID=A0A699JZI4_TANCI|nr:hypothetical protein [Tanacetum cinerariifolium]